MKSIRRNSRNFYKFRFIIAIIETNNLVIREKKNEKNAIEIAFSSNFFFKNFFPLAIKIEQTTNKKERQKQYLLNNRGGGI